MKTRYILVFILLLAWGGIRAQEFKGGILGGLNSARIDNDSHELFGKMGINAGFFVARDIMPDFLYWQMELKYTMRGKYQGPTATFTGLEIIDLRYLEMPLTVQAIFNGKIHVGLGLAPDVLLQEYYEDENGPISADLAKDLDRFGLTALGEINYFFKPKLAAGVRFNYSLIAMPSAISIPATFTMC